MVVSEGEEEELGRLAETETLESGSPKLPSDEFVSVLLRIPGQLVILDWVLVLVQVAYLALIHYHHGHGPKPVSLLTFIFYVFDDMTSSLIFQLRP